MTNKNELSPIDKENPGDHTGSLSSLFNAKSMFLKFGRDLLIAAATCAIVASKTDIMGAGIDVALPILGMMGLMTAGAITAGRYVGGGIGLGLDAGYDMIRKNPPLTTSFFRKATAGISGTAGGLATSLLFVAFLHGIDGGFHTAHAQPEKTDKPLASMYAAIKQNPPLFEYEA